MQLSPVRFAKTKSSPKQRTTIANGIVMFRLRYCLGVHGTEQFRFDKHDPLTMISQQLRVIQNDMLRIITGNKISDRVKVTDMLQTTGMLSINQMIGYSVMMEAWKSKTFDIEPLSKLLSHGRNDDRILRSNTNNDATSSTIEPFAICARKLWNVSSSRFKSTNLTKVAKSEAKKTAQTLPV